MNCKASAREMVLTCWMRHLGQHSCRRRRLCRLKQRMGLRRVRLRRLWNVSEQFLLAATAQNLKRLVRFLAQRNLSPGASGA